MIEYHINLEPHIEKMKLLIISTVTICIIGIFLACQPKKGADNNSEGFVDLEVKEFIEQARKDSNAVILDVRTPGETAEGVIPGAIELDYNSGQFAREFKNLDKTKTYYVYCRSGGRSANASQELYDHGFTHVYNLLGGYMGYKSYESKL